MSENYIVINGKKAELTEEQLKALGIEPEKKRNNPFERVRRGERYFSADYKDVSNVWEGNDFMDDDFFESANYFNDKQFAEQVSLHQLLYRKLLKFAYDNDCEDTAEWNVKNKHYTVAYSFDERCFKPDWFVNYKYTGVYFSSKEAAERAIKEVIKPFMKEHPEFVW